MSKKIKIFLIVLAGMAGFSKNGYAQNDKGILSVNKRDTISAAGIQKLRLVGMKGMKLNISGTESGNIVYHLKIKANKQALNSQFGGGKITFENHGKTGELFFKDIAGNGGGRSNMTWIKELLTKSHRSHIEIEDVSLNISVPQRLVLSVDSKYSDVTISSIRDSVRLEGRSGRINVSDIGSNLQITNHYGDISVTDVKGSLNVDGKSSHIDLENVGSNLNVSADYSEIVINNVQGNVNDFDKSGSVQAQNVEGYFSHSGDYTRLDLSDIKGHVEIDNRNGNITLDRIGSLNIDADYTNVQAHTVTGKKGIQMHGKSGNVTFEKVNGPVKIDGDYMSINLSDIGGKVDVDDKSGSINADNLSGAFTGNGSYNHYEFNAFAGKSLNIENSSGNISINAVEPLENVNISNDYSDVTILMQNDFNGHVRLKAQNGQIDTNLPFTGDVSRNQSDNGMSLEGNTGTGKGNIIIQTQGGNIKLRKVKE